MCQLCLVKYHKSHDVVDIKEEQDEKYKTLVSCLDSVSGVLLLHKANFLTTKVELERKRNDCIRKIKTQKEVFFKEISQIFDKLEKDAYDSYT